MGLNSPPPECGLNLVTASNKHNMEQEICSTFIVGKQGRCQPHQAVTIKPETSHIDIMYLLICCDEDTSPLGYSSPKTHNLKSNRENTSGQPKLWSK